MIAVTTIRKLLQRLVEYCATHKVENFMLDVGFINYLNQSRGGNASFWSDENL